MSNFSTKTRNDKAQIRQIGNDKLEAEEQAKKVDEWAFANFCCELGEKVHEGAFANFDVNLVKKFT